MNTVAPVLSDPAVPPQARMLDRLRAATRPLHDRIEATGASARIMAPTVRTEDYRDFLLRTLAVIAPVEAWLAQAGRPDRPVPDAGGRTAALLADIRALGGGGPPEPVRTAAETVMAALPHGPGAILGCLYVLEGSSLGGAMIAKHLQRRFGAAADAFTRFHGGEGAKAGERWRRVQAMLATLDGPARDEAAVQDAEQTALALFGCFLTAYEGHPSAT